MLSQQQLSRILVIRMDRLGDFLMNVPVIQRLNDNFPQAELTVLCHPDQRAIAENLSGVDRILTGTLEEFSNLASWIKWFFELKSYRFDGVVMTHPHKYLHLMLWLLRIPLRIGYNRKWGFFLNHHSQDRKSSAKKHEIDYNLEILNGVCPKPWNGQCNLEFKAHPNYLNVLKSFRMNEERSRVVFHVTSSNPEKELPWAVFRRVIDKLLKEGKTQVILVGTGPEEKLKDLFEFPSDEGSFLNLVGKTSVTDLAMILNDSQCVVSLDSGPLHLAWMQQIPVVAIFLKGVTGSNPTRWGVYPNFSPAAQIYKYPSEISSDEILKAILKFVQKEEVTRSA